MAGASVWAVVGSLTGLLLGTVVGVATVKLLVDPYLLSEHDRYTEDVAPGIVGILTGAVVGTVAGAATGARASRRLWTGLVAAAVVGLLMLAAETQSTRFGNHSLVVLVVAVLVALPAAWIGRLAPSR